jgi:PAS domain S-box-containing protein
MSFIRPAAGEKPMDKKPKKDQPPKEILLSNQKNYEDLFNSLNDAATLFEMRSNGLPGRYLDVNDTLCRWLGYTRKELLAKSPLDISEKVDETVNSDVAGTFAKKGKSVIERTLVAKDGRRIPVEVNFHLITYEGKKAVLSISRDVSERNAAEEALRESEELFRRVFEQVPIGMAMSNQQFFFSRANKAFCDMFGYTEQELFGMTFRDITHPEHLKTDADNVMRLVKGEMPIYKTEKQYVGKNGSVLCGDLTLSVLRDSEGKFLHVLVIIENITQRKKSEEALNKAEKLESIGILAGGIAHDFNNLLTAIFGYIDVARLYNSSGASDKVTMNLSKALEVFNRARAHPPAPYLFKRRYSC